MQIGRLGFFGALIWLCAVNPAQAQNVEIEDVYSRLSQNDKLEVEEILDEVYRFHNQHLDLAPKIKMVLQAYSSKSSYARFEERRGITRSAGVYIPSEKMAAVNLDSHTYLGTVIHEGQHYILGSVTRTVPSWINEGFSEFIETAYVQSHQVSARLHPYNLKLVRRAYEAEALPGLADYFRLSRRQWYSYDFRSRGLPRAMGWSLVYFLLSSEEGKSVLGGLIQRHASRKHRGSKYVEALYPGGVKKMESDWLNFLENPPDEVDFNGPYEALEDADVPALKVVSVLKDNQKSGWLAHLLSVIFK